MSEKRATPGRDSASYARRKLSGHFTQIENRFIRGYHHFGPAVKMTYIAIRSYAWKGDTFVGQKRLAKDCNVTVRTIQRHIQILEEEGLIEVKPRGAHLTNVMTTPELPDTTPGQEAPRANDMTPASHQGASLEATSVTHQ